MVVLIYKILKHKQILTSQPQTLRQVTPNLTTSKFIFVSNLTFYGMNYKVIILDISKVHERVYNSIPNTNKPSGHQNIWDNNICQA